MMNEENLSLLRRAAADIATDALLFALLSNADNSKALVEERALEILLTNFHLTHDDSKNGLGCFLKDHDQFKASSNAEPIRGHRYCKAYDPSVSMDTLQYIIKNCASNSCNELQSKYFQQKLGQCEEIVQDLICRLELARKQNGDSHPDGNRSLDTALLRAFEDLRVQIATEMQAMHLEADRVTDLIRLQEHRLNLLLQKEHQLSNEKQLLLKQQAAMEQERLLLLHSIDALSIKLVEGGALRNEITQREREISQRLHHELEMRNSENRKLENEVESLRRQMGHAPVFQYEAVISQLVETLNSISQDVNTLTLELQMEKSKTDRAEAQINILYTRAEAASAQMQILATENRTLHERLNQIKIRCVDLMKLKSFEDELQSWKDLANELKMSQLSANEHKQREIFPDTKECEDNAKFSLLPQSQVARLRRKSTEAISHLLDVIEGPENVEVNPAGKNKASLLVGGDNADATVPFILSRSHGSHST